MLKIAEEYVDEARQAFGAGLPATRMVAARKFADDLMRGDPAQCKAGYGATNAAIATAKAFDFDEEETRKLAGYTGGAHPTVVWEAVERERAAVRPAGYAVEQMGVVE